MTKVEKIIGVELSNNKSGISIIGCGAISDIHAQAIQQSANAELISVYSRTEKNAKRVG